MDPIADSLKIFKQLAVEFGDSPITGEERITNFFEALKERTSGLVIVDFLDLANWDCFETFKIQNHGILQLVWHDYRSKDESPHKRQLRESIFPASIYSLALSVNSIVPISSNVATVFLINGFAKTEKEIRKIFSAEGTEIEILDNSFFEKRIIRRIGEDYEVCDFHCTPIFSIAIVPKALRISSHDSKSLLYLYNYSSSLDRLERVSKALSDTDTLHPDDIAGNVNTVRRIFEFVLKVECCADELEMRKSYSQILLGDLISLVKRNKNQEIQKLLGNFAEIVNEFSHDSGKPIEPAKAKLAVFIAIFYVKSLIMQEKFKDLS